MPEGVKEPIKLFYCYANEDKALVSTFQNHLRILKRKLFIEIWSTENIRAGQEVATEIDRQLSTADVILLFVSADFLASDYCYGEEILRALQRHEEGTARVIPVLLRPVDWEDAPFSKLQVLPTNATPIISWSNLDDAYVHIMKELRRVVEELLAARETAENWLESVDLEKELRSLPVVFINFNEYTPASSEEIEAYYKGKSLSWEIILAQADILRDQQQQLIDEYSQPLNKTRMICLSGEPGAGKSTLARRLSFEIAQSSEQLLIHLPESAGGDIWYQLRKVLSPQQRPLLILVDDVFRSDDVVSALSSFNLHLNVVIIATTRRNEIPEDLRLPFLQLVELEPPSEHEKTLVTQKLQRGPLNERQTMLLAQANSWLVMMIELTSGESLKKIVRDSINRLKSDLQGQVVYRVYKYLCYVGQYQLSMPADLLLDAAKESFYKLEEDPRGQGLIVYDDANTSYSTLHPVFAELAFKAYRILPNPILLDIIDAIQVDKRFHRVFLCSILRRSITLGQQEALVHALLLQKAEKINALLEQSTHSELWHHWRPLYKKLHNDEKLALITNMMLQKVPETSLEWIVYLKFINGKGLSNDHARAIEVARNWFSSHAQDQNARAVFLALVDHWGTNELGRVLVEDTDLWLRTHPEEFSVRAAYLGLVNKRGTQQHRYQAIEDTTLWLNMHREDPNIRAAHLKLVQSQGKEEHWDQALEDATLWIKAREEDFNICEAYLGLANSRGNQEHWKLALETTALWLKSQPEGSNLWLAYLRMVEKHGTNEQRLQALEDAALWLKTQPEDHKVRTAYLGLIEKQGTDEQHMSAIEETILWLKAHAEDRDLRKMYLGVVEKRSTEMQCFEAIEDTARWLIAHPQDTQVRAVYIGLVERQGTDEQCIRAINVVTPSLANHPQNSDLRKLYIGLVERRGTHEQRIGAIEDTKRWLAGHPENIQLRAAYIKLIAEWGTSEQRETTLNETMSWLETHSHSMPVQEASFLLLDDHSDRGRIAHLKLAERRGREKFVIKLIEDTALWLNNHPDDLHVRAAYLSLVTKKGNGKKALVEISHWLKTHQGDARLWVAYLDVAGKWAKNEILRNEILEKTSNWLNAHPKEDMVRESYIELVHSWVTDNRCATVIEDTTRWLKDNPEAGGVRAVYLELVEKRGKKYSNMVLEDTNHWLRDHPEDTRVRAIYAKWITRQGTPEQQKRATQELFQWLGTGSGDVPVFIPYFKLVDAWGTPEQCSKTLDMAAPYLSTEPHNEFLWATYLLLVVKRGNTEQLARTQQLARGWLVAHPQSTNTYVLDCYGNILLKQELYDQAEVFFRRVLKRDKSYVPSRISLAWSFYHQGKKTEAYQEFIYCQQQVEKGSKYPIEGVLLHLGLYSMLEGMVDDAIASFQRAIQKTPHYQQYIALGRALFMKKDYSRAMLAFQQGKELLQQTIAPEVHPEIYQEIDQLFATVSQAEKNPSM